MIGFSLQALILFLLIKTFHKQLKDGAIGDINIGGVDLSLVPSHRWRTQPAAAP